MSSSATREEKPDRALYSLKSLAWLLIVLFAITAAIALLAALDAGASYLDLARAGKVPHSAYEVPGLVGILHLLSLPIGVLFIAWFYRAYSNLASSGYRLSHRVSSAIWSWFIPVGNLFAPKQIANEIWRADTAFASPDDEVEAWRLQPVDRSVHGWWALWIASSLAFPVAFFLLPDTYGALLEIGPQLKPSRAQAEFAQFLLSCACLAYGAAALLAAHFVRQITRKQRYLALPHEQVADVVDPEAVDEDAPPPPLPPLYGE